MTEKSSADVIVVTNHQEHALHSERNNSNEDVIAFDAAAEHQLSLLHVLTHHRPLVWWAFFFAVSAVGW